MTIRPLSLVAVAALLLAGCGDSGSDKQTTTSAAAATSTPTAETPVAATSTTATSTPGDHPDTDGDGVGDAITVKGRTGDALTLLGSGYGPSGPKAKPRLKVTLKDVRGPFSGYNVGAGHKLIGIDLHIANVGEEPFKDPQPGGTLTLVDGDTGSQTSLITVGKKSPCDNPSVSLKRGQSKDVCVAFEVPKDGKLNTFQLTVDSVGDKGLWQLR